MKIETAILPTVVTLLLVGIFFIAAKSTIPQRWNENLVGVHRRNIHLVLGYPDANFMPKGWEGWSQGVVIGAWVLTVHYSEDEKVVNVNRKFDWGFAHYNWNFDYKKKISSKEKARKDE